MVEHPQMLGLAGVDVLDWRVVAERDDLDPLKPHHPVGLGPAPVVADAHADDRILHAPHPKALVADVEIALFEVLERRLWQVLGVPRQVDLAVAPDDMPGRINQDRRVVMARLAVFPGQLGVAEIEADAELAGEVETTAASRRSASRARNSGRSPPVRSSTSAERRWSVPAPER